MDGQRFDNITRIVAAGASRRRLLKGLAGGLVALVGGKQVAQAQDGGNSACAHFCNAVFPPGRQRGQCTSAAARGEAGNLCAACLADPTNICISQGGQISCPNCGPGFQVNPVTCQCVPVVTCPTFCFFGLCPTGCRCVGGRCVAI